MTNDLTHWGIKGMKWGIRRFQNKDGSLTSLGKKRKQQNDKPEETAEQKKERILKSKSAKELYKNADLFSDAELQKAYNRLVLERNIAGLSANEKSKGESFVEGTIKWTKKTSELINAGTGMYDSVKKVMKIAGIDTSKTDGVAETTKYLNKNISKMTDEELVKALKRATSEKALNNIINEQKKKDND